VANLLAQHFVKDLETGAFEVDASEIAACVDVAYRSDRLEASHPEAQIWMVLAMFVDLADAQKESYDYWNCQCRF
jgi:hypothetical protein